MLAPLLVACVAAFAVAAARVAAQTRAEAALATALVADAADQPIAGALPDGVSLARIDDARIAVGVDAPLGRIVLDAARVRG